jgi:hypothetical protein
MRDEFEKTRQRTIRYWFNDGLSEIAFGGLCFLLALYFLAQVVLPKDSLLYNLLNASFVLVIIGGTLLTRRLIQVMKARLIYLRTGYVAYPIKRSHWWASALLAMGMAALVAFLFTRQPGSLVWLPAVTGLILAFVMLLFGLRTNLLRLYLIGILSLLLGGGLSLAGIGDILGLSAFYGSIGLVTGFSGGCALHTYLRITPLPEENADGE